VQGVDLDQIFGISTFWNEKKILFLDASKMGTMASRKLRVLEDTDLSKITDAYHAWRNKPTLREPQGSVYEDVDGFCKAATLEEVRKQDYKLTPGIYVGVEEAEADLEPFDEKMERLKATLVEQFEKGEELKKKILETAQQQRS
jgi:type I restriction enzyme M protein